MTTDTAPQPAAVDGASSADDAVTPLPPASNKVLVIGGHGVGKKFILQRLSSSSTPLTLSPLSLATSPSTSVVVRSHLHPIDTRYYTTTLHFHVLTDTDIPPLTPSSLTSLLSSPLLTACQGLLLVYDAASPTSFDHLTRWAPLLPHIDDDDAVLLIVGVERAPNTALDSVWAKARDWAIDHSIEHVRLRYNDGPAPAGEVGEAEEEGEEEEGVRRIAGAFEANHWEHMVMKDRAAAARQRLQRGDEGEDGGEREREGDGQWVDHPLSLNARLAADEEREEAELEAHLQAEEEEEARLEQERARLRQQLEVEGAKLDDEGEAVGEGKTAEEVAREDEAMEAHLTSFEAMFERMQNIRQEAMRAQRSPSGAQQGRPLSDAERRKRAEDAILNMLKSMGLDDEDGDDEEGEA